MNYSEVDKEILNCLDNESLLYDKLCFWAVSASGSRTLSSMEDIESVIQITDGFSVEGLKVIRISDCVFNFHFDLETVRNVIDKLVNCQDQYCIEIINCIFNSFFEIRQSDKAFDYALSFEKIIFNCPVHIHNTVFNKSVKFYIIVFGNYLTIDNCSFNKILLLSRSLFKLEVAIHDNQFNWTSTFFAIRSNSYFQHFNNFYGSLTFRKAWVNFFRCDDNIIADYLNIQSATCNKLLFNNLHFEKGFISISDLDVKELNRETAKLIKREAYRANDNILGMEYKVREMNEYRKEMRHWKSAGTYFVLWLNRWSNWYGKYWWLGVIFTVVVWVFSFSSFIICRDGWGDTFIWSDPEYMKEAVNYFWLFDGLSGLSKCDRLNWFMIFFFVLGKVFIGYGIYQTVSAFRRFGK